MGDSILRLATHTLAVIHLVLCGVGAVGMPFLVLQIIPQHTYSKPLLNVDSIHPEIAGLVYTWHYIIWTAGGYVLLTFQAAAAVILLKASVKDTSPQTAVKFAESWAIASLFEVFGWDIWIMAIAYYAYLTVRAFGVAVVVLKFVYAFQFAVVARYTEWQKINVTKLQTRSQFSSNAVQLAT